MTNADKLRQMTNEELAKWLVNVERAVIKKAHQISTIISDNLLIQDWVEWMREEVNDGN